MIKDPFNKFEQRNTLREVLETQDSILEKEGIASLYEKIPFIEKGSLPEYIATGLREKFDAEYDRIEFDTYDVRRKEMDILFEAYPQVESQISNAQKCAYYQGVDTQKAQQITEAIDLLKRNDQYKKILENITPDRKKLNSKYSLNLVENLWEHIPRKKNSGVTQKLEHDDIRSVPRIYNEIPHEIMNSKAMDLYIKSLIEMTLEQSPDKKRAVLQVWYMSTCVTKDQPGDNSPEGAHQDGADLISNFVIRRDAEVQGGESIVFYKNESGALDRLYGTELKVGEYMSQKDKGTKLWHTITKFHTENEGVFRRDILGADISF